MQLGNKPRHRLIKGFDWILIEAIFLIISEKLFLFLLKPFVAPGRRKYVIYFALGLTLEASLEMDHATGTQIS